MLNIVIRVESYVSWFLIPDNYPKNQFDALMNLPGANPMTHIGLWRQWILSIGGDYFGPRTLSEFHKLDGRHVNIKVDGDRVYIFNDPAIKTQFYANRLWCEVLNFDIKKLTWLNWLMSEPDVSLEKRYDNFQVAIGASIGSQSLLDDDSKIRRFVYSEVTRKFMPFDKGTGQ